MNNFQRFLRAAVYIGVAALIAFSASASGQSVWTLVGIVPLILGLYYLVQIPFSLFLKRQRQIREAA